MKKPLDSLSKAQLIDQTVIHPVTDQVHNTVQYFTCMQSKVKASFSMTVKRHIQILVQHVEIIKI